MMESSSLIKSNSILLLSDSKNYLYFICNDPVFYPPLGKETFLGINFARIIWDIRFDSSCMLDKNDLSFIEYPNYICYQKADIFDSDIVAQQMLSGDIKIHKLCNNDVFKRILTGLEYSPYVKPKIWNYYQQYCVVE